MRKNTLIFHCFLLFLVIAFSGCANEQYYLNPTSPGYDEQVWNGECEQCHRFFTMSSRQYDQGGTISCPFCGHVQDTQMSRNRGKYAEAEAQAQSNANVAMALYQANQDYQARQQQNLQNFQNHFVSNGSSRLRTNCTTHHSSSGSYSNTTCS